MMWKDQEMGTLKEYNRNVEHPTDILFSTGLNWLSGRETIHYFVTKTKEMLTEKPIHLASSYL